MTTINYVPTAPEDWCSPCQMAGHNACIGRSGGLCVCSCSAQAAPQREAFGEDFVLGADLCPVCTAGQHKECTGCACDCTLVLRPPGRYVA
jgi:hypothetical protein